MEPCKILVIDDDKDDVEFLAEALHQQGENSIHFVHSAKQALDYLNSFRLKEDLPKVIITDIFFPVDKGTNLIVDLKSSEDYMQIPIVILSSLPVLEGSRFKQLGVVDYIRKPNTYNEYQRIAKYLTTRIVA